MLVLVVEPAIGSNDEGRDANSREGSPDKVMAHAGEGSGKVKEDESTLVVLAVEEGVIPSPECRDVKVEDVLENAPAREKATLHRIDEVVSKGGELITEDVSNDTVEAVDNREGTKVHRGHGRAKNVIFNNSFLHEQEEPSFVEVGNEIIGSSGKREQEEGKGEQNETGEAKDTTIGDIGDAIGARSRVPRVLNGAAEVPLVGVPVTIRDRGKAPPGFGEVIQPALHMTSLGSTHVFMIKGLLPVSVDEVGGVLGIGHSSFTVPKVRGGPSIAEMRFINSGG